MLTCSTLDFSLLQAPEPAHLLAWRKELRRNVRSVAELCELLKLNTEQRARVDSSPRFPLNLPRRLLSKMPVGTLEHPITRQFVPLVEEREEREGWELDPVCDQSFQKTEGMLHKYASRVLLLPTGSCAVHCRYCFRQNYDYPVQQDLHTELGYVAADQSLREVILSGGDPLMLSDRLLSALCRQLDAIPHLRRLRFHTRLPIGLPERLHAPFLQMLSALRCQVYLVIHANHPLELDTEVQDALRRCVRHGVVVLNQAVLLRGVNDTVEALQELSERLVDCGALPYYLHQLDRVRGAAHFEVPEEEGLALVEALRERVSGYAVPTYVREVAGEPSKTPLPL